MSEIANIFAKDPLGLTQDDITATVKFYREQRANFIIAEKAGLKAGSTKLTAKQEEASKAAGSIDLGDLLG